MASGLLFKMSPSVYQFSRLLIGVALVLAGVSKLLPVEPLMLTPNWLVPSTLVVILAVAEIGLGICCLRFVPSRWLARILVGLFTLFLVVLLVRLQAGSSTCPCMGGLDVSIGWMVVFDAVCLASIFGFYTYWSDRRSVESGETGVLIGLSNGMSVVLPVALLLTGVGFGSLPAFLTWAAGSDLYARSAHRSIGLMEAGETRQVTFQVANSTNQPIRIIGAKSSCSCSALQDLPLDIPGKSTKDISMQVTCRPTDVGKFVAYESVLLKSDTKWGIRLVVDGAVKATVSR